jgi:hypothetical protein
VKRVAAAQGVSIDYGPGNVKKWPRGELRKRLREGFGAVTLGDYEKAPIRITNFNEDHSAWVHGARTHEGVEQCHWHDPLAEEAVWVPIAKVEAYWTFTGSVSRATAAQLAGFVRLEGTKATKAAEAAEEEDEMPELLVTRVGPFTVDIPANKQLFDLAGRPLIEVSVPQVGRFAPFETKVGDTAFLAVELTTGGKRQLVLVKPGDATIRPAGGAIDADAFAAGARAVAEALRGQLDTTAEKVITEK